MSLVLRAMLLVVCISIGAPAQSRKVQLFAKPANRLDKQSEFVMRIELQRLLMPAGLDIVWKNPKELQTGEGFDFVVVGSFEGHCSLGDSLPDPVNNASGTLSLAGTSTSNRRIIPFFNVDCTRVMRMLSPKFERLRPEDRQLLLGRALGRVVAHEIYHIVANTAEHADLGVAKAAFSVRDLTAARFEFNRASIEAMHPARPSVE